MSDMTHEEAVEELAGVALGAAPTGVAERVRAHARGCPDCAGELRGFDGTTRELGGLIPDHPINPGRAAGIRSRLLSRANTDTDRRAVGVTSTVASRVKPAAVQKPVTVQTARTREVPIERSSGMGLPSSFMGIVAALATLVATGAVIQMMRANAEATSLRATIDVQTDSIEAPLKSPDMETTEKDRIINGVTGPDVRVIGLTHYGARGVVARMFWNRESNSWTLVSYSIRQPRPGKVFQVWLATANGRISAGTFVPDASGKAIVQSNNVVARDALESISVTEEEQGGAPAPGGPVVIAGAP